MANWDGGYASHNRYMDTIQSNTLPLKMDVNLLAAGRALPHRGGNFRYAELGCGTAYGMIGMAAANPNGQFEGYDFMPEHVARARSMISDVGLENINVSEASFEELVAAAPPEPFDYIILHGVWSWVSKENQDFLTQILGRWLKPGGIAYLGYATAAGCLPLWPIRRLFVEVKGNDPADRYGPARAAVDALAEIWPETEVKRMWGHFKGLADDFIDHDFGAEHASAQWHPELVEALSPAKLEYVCSANLIEQFPPLCFGEKQMAFVGKAMQEGWGETASDLAFARTFRSDLFGRGAPMLPPAEVWKQVLGMTIDPCDHALAGDANVFISENSPRLEQSVLEMVRSVLASGSQTVAQFVDSLEVEDRGGLQLALMATSQAEARIVRSPEEVKGSEDGVAAFNAVVRKGWDQGVSYPGLASAKLGGGITLSEAEMDVAFGADGADEKVKVALGRLALTGTPITSVS